MFFVVWTPSEQDPHPSVFQYQKYENSVEEDGDNNHSHCEINHRSNHFYVLRTQT